MLDDITQAVLSREDVARYLRGGHGETELQARERICGYLEELRTTQRYPIYRALKHPLYPILRKIERLAENVEIAAAGHRAPAASSTRRTTRATSTTWSSRWCSTTTASGRRSWPPASTCSAAPLGLLHRHVTGAMPIRRNTKDPAYLITLKAYVAELLQRHDLLFYTEGGRSYSGELKAPKTGPDPRRAAGGPHGPGDRADGRGLRRRARGSHPGAPGGQAARSGRSAASWRRWSATPSATSRARS